MAVKVKFGLAETSVSFPATCDKKKEKNGTMQNKANTSSVSNFAMKITLKKGHVMTYPK